jgi:glycogen synthase
VFPSRYEAMSLSLLEAMAAGLPVVTARTAGGAEIITPECGIVLEDPDDPKALASAIAQLAESGDTRRAMGVAANELATGFGWARMAAQYIALYRQLAGQQEDRQRVGTAVDAEPLAASMLTGHKGIESRGIELMSAGYTGTEYKGVE